VEHIALLKLRFFLAEGLSHTSKREHEGFYVVEGQIIFYVDGQRIEAKPGTFINIPPNVLHSFKNETNENAKLRLEQFFVETGLEVSNNSVKPPPLTDEQTQKLVSLASKYGMEIRPP
jgi:glyoxylate utilization-related uncharacterized protein